MKSFLLSTSLLLTFIAESAHEIPQLNYLPSYGSTESKPNATTNHFSSRSGFNPRQQQNNSNSDGTRKPEASDQVTCDIIESAERICTREGVLRGPARILIAHCKKMNISLERCKCSFVQHLYYNATHHNCEIQLRFHNMNEIPSSTKHKVHHLKGIVASTAAVSLCGIVGNMLVLVIRSRENVASLHYQVIMCLAFTDLWCSFTHLMFYVPYLVYGVRWVYGDVMCKLIPSFLKFSSNIDIGFIVIIAIERYVAIHSTRKGGISRSKIYTLECINVIVGMLSILPMLMTYEINPANGICYQNWKDYRHALKTYAWISFVTFFVVPVISTGYLYCVSFKVLQKTVFRRELLDSIDEGSRKRRMMDNRRMSAVLCSLLIAFVALISPNYISWLILNYLNDNAPSELKLILNLFGEIPHTTYICINPIIYSVVDKRFRDDARRLLKCQRTNTFI